MPELYIGLMSGTSIDGIDAALVEIHESKTRLLATHQHPIDPSLKNTLHQLALNKHNIDLDLLGSCDAELGEVFAEACLQLLEKNHFKPSQIKAIGSHGQTIRHQPDIQHPFSMQIGDANRIAYKTGITTISDFRRMDIAAGGQGAPLVPAFHQASFSSDTENRAIVNIGGIANLSYLPKDRSNKVLGFDCGPGNTLMDAWIHKIKNKDYDKEGKWAASSKPHAELLEKLLQDEFIHTRPPKSTGREHYHLDWLKQLNTFENISDAQVQATLCAFTVHSIRYAIEHFLPPVDTLIVCGGGAHNLHLMQQLGEHLCNINIQTSDQLGIATDWVEAAAFAWLAHQTLHQHTGNLAEASGASKSVILGATYFAT